MQLWTNTSTTAAVTAAATTNTTYVQYRVLL